jgi:hypothetical protein
MRRLPGRLQALTAAALVLAPAWAAAQPPLEREPVTVPGGGTEVFRSLLNYAKIKPVTEQEFRTLRLRQQFDDIILISLGNPQTSVRTGVNPLEFLETASARGSALIATDTQVTLTTSLGARFAVTGERVECLDDEARHRDRRGCPYLVPINVDGPAATTGLFRGLNRVAANSASWISVQPDGWGGDLQHRLARFPAGCVRTPSGRAVPEFAYFAVGGNGPDGFGNRNRYRFLVMADHSVFINQMLLEPGTDNLELAYRVIEYLQGPDKTRKRCIFFEDGRLVQTFDDLGRAAAQQNQPPLPQVNLWALQDKLTDLGNAVIDRLQSNNAHNKLLLGSNESLSLAYVARFLVVVAAAAACFFVLRRVWAARKPTDTPAPPPVAAAPSGPPGVFDRRQKELLRRNNVYEPVRDLVRDFFESLGVPADAPARPPALVIADVVRKPDSLRAAVRDFWKIAFGPAQAMTVSRWRELEPFFERVRQAHADGKWRFVSAESTAGSVA